MKVKKKSRKTLIRLLDAKVSLIVRERDGACVQCRTKENLTCGHVFSRQNYSTRWSLLNCHCQCLKHNLRHEYEPYWYYRWFVRKFGQEEFDALFDKHNEIKKWKDWELQELLDSLNG